MNIVPNWQGQKSETEFICQILSQTCQQRLCTVVALCSALLCCCSILLLCCYGTVLCTTEMLKHCTLHWYSVVLCSLYYCCTAVLLFYLLLDCYYLLYLQYCWLTATQYWTVGVLEISSIVLWKRTNKQAKNKRNRVSNSAPLSKGKP